MKQGWNNLTEGLIPCVFSIAGAELSVKAHSLSVVAVATRTIRDFPHQRDCGSKRPSRRDSAPSPSLEGELLSASLWCVVISFGLMGLKSLSTPEAIQAPQKRTWGWGECTQALGTSACQDPSCSTVMAVLNCHRKTRDGVVEATWTAQGFLQVAPLLSGMDSLITQAFPARDR